MEILYQFVAIPLVPTVSDDTLYLNSSSNFIPINCKKLLRLNNKLTSCYFKYQLNIVDRSKKVSNYVDGYHLQLEVATAKASLMECHEVALYSQL